ncbi:MAG: DUF4136 domain-containing protein [Bacteroidetes bacterium]|nr:DUF4136 domain-containing protein [Bacteroidota bacterium]
MLEVTSTTYYYDYWDYYYGWYYGPGYGGWYYPYPVTSSYTTGTLILNMVDNKNPNPSNKGKIVWVGLVNGLLEGSSADYINRINKTIDQSFAQSTYLRP